MPDKTRIYDGWAVAPWDVVSHYLVDDKPLCDSVQRDVWYAPGWANKHCMVCEKKVTELRLA